MEQPEKWEEARKVLVYKLLNKVDASGPCLDIGCGKGEKWFTETYGIDIEPLCVAEATKKGITGLEIDCTALPFPDRYFSTVLMLDVLEHLDEPEKALAEISRVTHNASTLIIAVPLFPFLWSKHDETVGHKKRYKPGEVKQLAGQYGFEYQLSTCWNITSLPGALIRKIMPMNTVPSWLGKIMQVEAKIAGKYSMPIGLSEFTVFRKAV